MVIVTRKLTAGSPENHHFFKENHLNRTSIFRVSVLVFLGVCKLLHSCFSLVVSLGVLFVQRHLVIAPKLGYERDRGVGRETIFGGHFSLSFDREKHISVPPESRLKTSQL